MPGSHSKKDKLKKRIAALDDVTSQHKKKRKDKEKLIHGAKGFSNIDKINNRITDREKRLAEKAIIEQTPEDKQDVRAHITRDQNLMDNVPKEKWKEYTDPQSLAKGVAPNYGNPSKVKKKRLKGKVSKLKSRLAGLTHKKKSTQFPVGKDPAGKPLWNVDKSGIPKTKADRMKRYEYLKHQQGQGGMGTVYQDVKGNQVTKEEYDKGGPNITDTDFGRKKGKSFGAKKAEDHEHSIQFKGYRGQYYKRANLVSTQGKFAKYWLLNAKQTNGNGWGVSQQSIAKNIHKFVGRPLVVTAKSWVPESVYGDVYEHPYLPTNDIGQVLNHQEKYRVGNIVDIIEKNGDYYANIEINQKFAHMILPPFCSPAIFQNNPAEAEGQISDWEALHLAALHEDPAYGSRIALLRGTCVGTQDQCTIQFKSAKQEAKVICTKDLKGRLATLKKNDLSQRIATFKNKTATPMSEHSGIFSTGGSVEAHDIAPANYKGKGKKLVSQPNIKVKGDIRINKYSDLPPQKIGDPHPDMKSEGNIKSKNVRTKHGVVPRYTIKNKDIPAERVEGAIISTDEGITHLPSEVSLKRDLRSGEEQFVGDKSYHSKPTKKQRDWIKKVEALRKEYTSVQIDEPEYNKRMSELQSRSPFEKRGGYNPFPNTKEVYTKLDHEPSWDMEADAVEDVETINTTESPGTFEVMKEKYRDSLDYVTQPEGSPIGEWVQREDYGSGMDTSISPENLEEGNDFGSVTDKEKGFRPVGETPLRGERTDISREDRAKNRQEARQIALQYIPGATNMSAERLDELLDYISRNDIESFEDANPLSISRDDA